MPGTVEMAHFWYNLITKLDQTKNFKEIRVVFESSVQNIVKILLFVITTKTQAIHHSRKQNLLSTNGTTL